jgi:hypothetical protein
VVKERRCSGYGGTPAGGGDLRVVLRHGEAKGKMRRGFQGEAMAARSELTVRTSRRWCSSAIPMGRPISVADGEREVNGGTRGVTRGPDRGGKRRGEKF